MPQPAMSKQTIPKVPGGVATPAAAAAGIAGQDEEDDEHYYIYDEDEYGEEDEDNEQAAPLAAAREKQMPMPGGGAGSFHIPDSQLIQDWPYGNSVNLEGKSTLTYSPTHPMQPAAGGYFPQMPPPGAVRQPLPPPAMYGSPVVPPPAIGPGFFSSPERPAYAQRFQSPTHLGMPNSQTAAMVGLAAQQAALTPPKPGFLPATTVQPATTTVAAAKIPPPNASLTATGAVINPPSMTATPNTAAAALTGGTIFKMNLGEATPEQTAFGTKFIMTMPPGSSSEPKPPASLSSPGFTFGLSDGTNPSNIDYPEEEEDDTLAGDDSYQGPDFEPIIPLPDEVEVVTGEEEENILYGARAKLFRFTENQWKERGLGEIKILHHKATGRVRIVMRREQVHKVCANHSLSPEMTIKFKSPSEKKVLTWQAMDFAEGQSQMEQLCAKFKSEDIALQFKEKFEEGVKLSGKKKPEIKDKPAAKSSEAAKAESLFDKFKPKVGSWDCDTCMVNNKADTKKCVACNTLKPGASPEKDEGPKLSFPAGGGFSFGGAPGAGAGAASGGGFSFGKSTFGFGSSTSSLAVGGTSTPSTSLPKVASAPQFGTPASSGSGFMFAGSGTSGESGTPKFSFGTPAASENKPSIVFGKSGTTSTPDTGSKATPAISPAKLNVASSTTTTEPASKSVFAFGTSSLSGGTPFKFGESKPAEATSTPASDMLKNIAAQTKPTETPKPKATGNQIGGFTFTSTPVIAAENVKPIPQKEEEKEKPQEAKTSPFAGFSFGSSAKNSTPTFGGTPSMSTFGSASSSGTPTFGSIGSQNVTTITTSSKTPEKEFGSNSNADIKTFGSLAGDDKSKPDAFSKKTDFKGFSGAGQQLFKSPNKSGKGDEGGADEEYEPDVDFKPIIPLPDLVAVETGEENEEKLFNSRVKLFRHDQNTKQWKERGIGEIKILKHKETSRCRLLMRREQVLKICCNQTISPNVKLQKMATSEKAWCWVAQDFSEGETKVEQFACKFKSPEVAQQFKEVYEAAALLKVKEPAVSTKPEKKLEDKSQPSLKEMFQPKPGAWQCDVCLVMNSNGEVCPACLTPKPGCAPPAPTQSENVTSSGFKFGSGGGFTFGNKEAQDQPKSEKTSEAAAKPQPQSLKDLLASNDDSSAKPSEVSSTSGGGFKFGSSGAFTFGKSSDDKDSTDAPKAPFTFTPSGPSTEFVFGKSTPEKSGETPSQGFTFTPNKADSTVSSSTGSGFVFGKESTNTSFSFGGVTPSKPLDLSASKSPKSPGVEDFYVNQDGEDSHIYFEPIIQLEKVEVKTGEEEEEVLYSHRAKLFRFFDTEWKERGLGDVKILMHKKTQKRRILMRREQVHKICLNHYITPELNLMPMNNAQGKAWVWYAEDFVEGESSHEQLAIRFKTKDTADEFKEAFIKAQEEMKKYSTPTKAEEQAQSDKNTAKDAHAPSAKQSLVDKFAAKDGEWDCKACLVRNKAGSTSCLACLTAREGEQSGQVSSSSPSSNPTFGGTPSFGSFSFKSPTQSSEPEPGKGFSFGSTPVFGAAKGFSFGTAGLTTGSMFGKPAESSEANKGTSILASMLQEPSDKGKLQ